MDGSTFFVVVIYRAVDKRKCMLKSGKSKDGTIREYLDWIKDIRVENEQNLLFDHTNIFYRGQGNHTWKIIPSVFRTNKGTYSEFFLYKHARSLAWDVLNNCKSSIEIMVKLQHFGLPTRLIDITHNPLVALYFACNKEPNKNGVVYWGTNELFCDDRFAEVIAREVMKHNNGYTCKNIRRMFPDLFTNVELWSDSDMNRLNFCIKGLSNPYYILPPYNNSRIKAQKGAFIIPPLICTNGITILDENTFYPESNHEIDYRTHFNNAVNEQITVFKSQKYIVRAKHKNMILEELKELGVDKSTLFPDNVEFLMSQIADSVRDRITGI